jgi:SAM-dependent methyltransferase
VLYTYGLKAGLTLARNGSPRGALRKLRVPVSYWRGVEYALVSRWGDFRADQRVLDIGSPKLLSSYLATEVGARVVATDINPYFIADCQLLARAARLPPDRFVAQVEDGRDLSFADDSFDRVYSISVVEHIEDGGDLRCLAEIGRVLKPGGLALITVPFSPRSRDVYRPADYAYWTHRDGADDQEDVFFERRYSEEDLWRRLIEPSALSLKKMQFVGERIAGRADRDIWELIPWALGPVHPVISALLHDGPADSWHEVRHPALAFMALEK